MIKKLLVSGVTLAMCLGSFAGCGDNMPSQERIERITGMVLPQEAKEEYYDWGMAFDGAYLLYAVFRFKEEPKAFLAAYSFEEAEATYTVESDVFSHYVPDEVRLSFNGEPYMGMRLECKDEGWGSASYFPRMQKLLITLQRN